jgi:hypothetical protein
VPIGGLMRGRTVWASCGSSPSLVTDREDGTTRNGFDLGTARGPVLRANHVSAYQDWLCSRADVHQPHTARQTDDRGKNPRRQMPSRDRRSTKVLSSNTTAALLFSRPTQLPAITKSLPAFEMMPRSAFRLYLRMPRASPEGVQVRMRRA